MKMGTESVAEELIKKHYNIILKLNCYYELKTVDCDGKELGDLNPDILLKYVGRKPMYLYFTNSLLTTDPDDMHMVLYNPSKAVLSIVKQIAASEGMFLWKSGR